MRSSSRRMGVLASAFVVACAAACGERSPAITAVPQAEAVGSVGDIMRMLDPSADAVWSSVATIVSRAGTEERAPKDQAEWDALRIHAVTLAEAANLLMLPGRAPRSPVWHARAAQLRSAAVEALQAIDARRPAAVLQAGEHLTDACDRCHDTFWKGWHASDASPAVIRDTLLQQPGVLRAASPPSAGPGQDACADLTAAPAGALLTRAVRIEAGAFTVDELSDADRRLFASLPPFCRVVFTLHPEADSEIGAEVWLPVDRWNGKFQGVGNRGWGGSINYPLLAQAVAAGYAAASTDTGHRGRGAEFALGHRARVVDAGARAVHLTTVAAKAIVVSHYGRPLHFSYWNGCSLGGRQGLMEVQRYPGDYDAVVVGDPAFNVVDLYSARVEIARLVNRSTTSRLGPDSLRVLHRAVIDACDASDGVRDGVLEDPSVCQYDPATLACSSNSDSAACLSNEQVDTARRLRRPVLHPRSGAMLSEGMLPGTEEGWLAVAGPEPEQNALGLFRYIVSGDPAWDWRRRNFEEWIDRAAAAWSPVLDAIDTDISAFMQRGGKLLLYHGWADAQTPAGNTIAYVAALRDRLGLAATDAAVRLFMAPGVGHCEGGSGPDVWDKVAVLDRWVQSGSPPASVVASRVVDGRVVRTRPLCPLGSTARWDRQGSTDEAASFRCVTTRPEIGRTP